MDTMQARAKDLLPSVLLTLLSIIQALALEMLWASLDESPYLWAGGWQSILGWLQVAVMLLGILQIWLFYTSLVMRFRWVPSTRDSILPFVIGILEFTLIDLLGPATLAPWFCVLAIIFAISTWESHKMFMRARQDPENREFFENVERAKLVDFAAPIASVSGLVLFGVVLHVSGSPTWLALAGLLAALVMLAYQIALMRRYWDLAMLGRQG
jgi:hypothetical protein